MTAPWLILRSLRMSEDRRRALAEDIHSVGGETYHPMVRQNMKALRKELTRSQRDANIMRPRVVSLFANTHFVRCLDLGILEERPGTKPRELGLVPIGTVVSHTPCVEPVEHRRIREVTTGLLAIGHDFLRVPDEDILKLKRREVDGIIPGTSSAEWKDLKKGDDIWVTEGPFTGRKAKIEEPPAGEFEKLDINSRLTVALQVFADRVTLVELKIGAIRKA